MAEKQVTIDNQTYPLDELFFVIGTQNPLDLAGTYPLPLVQLDRFLLKIPMSYVDSESELKILENHKQITEKANNSEAVCTQSDILKARQAANSVKISDSLRKAIIELVQATRDNPILKFGASTRSALMLQQAIRAWALIQKRDYATEDDFKYIAQFVLLHRLKFNSTINKPNDALNALMNPIIEKLINQ
ncbi:UNVERIFIED_CONTAM: hypothetical protein GTU68_055804 [Idotea baltica]|nr:hypothetical protein [Idotea baltica]